MIQNRYYSKEHVPVNQTNIKSNVHNVWVNINFIDMFLFDSWEDLGLENSQTDCVNGEYINIESEVTYLWLRGNIVRVFSLNSNCFILYTQGFSGPFVINGL